MSYFGRFQQVVGAVSVWYLRQKNLGTFLEAVGLTLDGAADGMLQGMRLGYPLRCPANQLPVVAFDRGIRLYPSEPEASRRHRLSMWWWLHKMRGSPQGKMRHVAPYFLPGGMPTIRIVHQSGDGATATWHTLSPNAPGSAAPGAIDPLVGYSVATASPSNFSYDEHPSAWSREWVFVNMAGTGFTPPATWGSFSWGDGTAWGQGSPNPFTAQMQQDIAAMFVEWTAAHSWLAGVILVWPVAGGAPFPSASGVPTQDSDGRWSLPNGANTWGGYVDPNTGKPTRPWNFQWIYESSPVFV